MSEAGRSSIGVRIRPNAHDFIRDLRAQLSSKRYTFYVNVGAQTGQATGDVRQWAKTVLPQINAKVPVGASLLKANSEVIQWRAKVRKTVVKVPIDVDLSRANRELELWRRAAGRDMEIRVKANVTGRGSVEGVRRSLEREAKVAVTVDSKQVREQVSDALDQPGLFSVEIDAKTKKAKARVTEFFDEVRGEQLEMDLGINTAPAADDVKEFKARQSGDPIVADLKLRKLKAQTELAELRLKERAKKIEIDVGVKAGAADRFARSLKEIEERVGNFAVLRSIDAGPITFGKPTGLVGTLVTATALAGLLPGLVTGVAALSDMFIRLAGAAALVPGALGGVVASLGTFSIGTQGFGDALTALFDVWNEGSDKMQSQAKKTASAQNSLRRALVDEKRAQEDVGKARRDATRELRDLNNELRGGVLNEAQAILDLQKAKDRMAQGDFDNQTDRLQAELDIRKAEQGLIDVRERNVRLQEDANEKSAKGVEGSDLVTQALENQTRATEQVAMAMEAVNDASSQGAMSTFADKLSQLSPNAQDAISAIAGLRGEMMDFRLELQDIIFQGVGDNIVSGFEKLMPVIGPGVREIAVGLNQNILQVFDTLSGPDGQSIISRILGGTAEAQKALTKVIDPLIRGIGTLVAAGAEHLPQVVDLIGRLADRFAAFIEKADQDGSLDKFLDAGVKALGDVAELGINAIKIINDFSNAFRGAFGEDLLSAMVRITGEWHTFLSSAEGQAKLNEYIADAKNIWEDWRPILEKLPGLFDAVSDGAMAFLDAATPILNAMAWTLEKMPWLISAIAAVWLGGKMLSAVKTAYDLGKAVAGIAGAARSALQLVGGLATKLGLIPTNWAARLGGAPAGVPAATPGATPGVLAAGGASALAGAAAAVAIPAATAAVILSQTPMDYSVSGADADRIINELGTKVPAGVPKYQDKEAQDAIKGVSIDTPLGKWLNEVPIGGGGRVEQAKRWTWLVTQPNAAELMSNPDTFQPPVIGSYKDGGFTDWGRQEGRVAVVHGKEFIQPADAVGYYGTNVMEAMRQQAIPREFFRGYDNGGVIDPNDPRTQHLPTPTNATAPNPVQGPGILPTLIDGATGITSSFASQATQPSTGMFNPLGGPTGALPGPATPGVTSPGTVTTPITTNIGGIDVPLGNVPAGWPGGTAPVGLGGGADGFDIRKYGIGPGPVGSTPSDWMSWGADFTGKYVKEFGSAILGGFLGIFGLEGIMNSPYVQAATGLVNHFAGGDQSGGAQGPGAAQTNADVNALLSTYDNMGTNPAYPGVGDMNQVFGADGSALGASPGSIPGNWTGQFGRTGSESGLQIKTINVKRAIEAAFPEIRSIGGWRKDALKWHPNGLAIDVMIPGGDTHNGANPTGKALGDRIYAYLMANQEKFGIDYILWQTDQGGNHYNHLHVNTVGGGYPPGGGPPPAGAAPVGPSPSESPQPSDAKKPPAAPNPLDILAPLDLPDSGKPSKKIGPGLFGATFDQGGWLMPGRTVVDNLTGKPELVVPHSALVSRGASNYVGGNPRAIPIPPPVPPRPNPRPNTQFQPKIVPAQPKIVPQPTPVSPPIAQAPATSTPPLAPQQPVQQPVEQGPSGAQVTTQPSTSIQSTAPGADSFMHLHPAIQKGIASGAAVLGNIAQTAAAVGSFGAAGGAGAALGAMGGGGGGAGPSIAGAIQQGGKIATNIANVGASFLVGNITGGTTANAYGVTQRGNIPSGGSTIYDASTQIGSIQTSDLDEYYRRENRRQAQRAQSNLGAWGNR